MKQLNKMILLAMFMSMVSISAKAQQTSMTIDNQSPGWLSSKIGYGDQQTVENLTVTGYLNNDDLRFIVSLAKNHSPVWPNVVCPEIVLCSKWLRELLKSIGKR